jgi:predicted HD phosphohydrolase
MGPAEVEAFRRHRFHREAVRVRLWDEAGKVAGMKTPAFAHYRPLLERVVARHGGKGVEASR